VIGKIWFVTFAFRKSTGWGLACIFIPFASLFFLFKSKKVLVPFLAAYFAAIPIIVGLIIMAEFGGQSYRDKMSKPPTEITNPRR
jgi:hypothetical protein